MSQFINDTGWIDRVTLPPDHGWETRARRDALRHIAKDIPDPAEFAFCLSLAELTAMQSARCEYSIWRVHPRLAAWLRPSGLCECGGTALTLFGVAVLRVLQEQGDA